MEDIECSVVTNKRIKSQDDEDRISALPDSLLQHILSFLPSTREAIQTGILSKTWQNQWTHVPVLIFEPRDKVFIENVLMLHNCPKIKELYLKYDYLSHPQFASIIGVAVGKRVEELTLFRDGDTYSLPEVLLDCSSLVRLKMVACHFCWLRKVSWPSLKSLEIDCHALRLVNRRSQRIGHAVWGSPVLESFEFRGVMLDRDGIVSKSLKKLTLVDVDIPGGVLILCRNLVELHVLTDRWFESTFPHRMIEDVLLDNPNIHTLELLNVTGFGHLVIASNSLKVLHLKLRYYPQRLPTKIEVSCPNLEKLDVSCFFDAFHAVNLSSSTEAALGYSCPRNDESVKGMLVQFQGVNELALESSFFWIIADSVGEIRLSLPMLNSKCLTLNVGGNFGLALSGIVYALRLPALETLVIKLKSKFYMRECDKDLQDLIMFKLHNWFSNGSGGHTCLVSNLKTVKIIGLNEKDDKCKVALEFIKFLLKNARVLKLLIVVLKGPGTGFAIEVSEKLAGFPRCSQSASIELSCST